MASNCLGATSKRMARALGSSSRDDTGLLTLTVPLKEVKYDVRASAIAWEPPLAMGQPTAWPNTDNINPKAAVEERSKGRIE